MGFYSVYFKNHLWLDHLKLETFFLPAKNYQSTKVNVKQSFVSQASIFNSLQKLIKH